MGIKNYTKREAVNIAVKCAKLYKENFVGQRLLFLMTDKHKYVSALEVEFAASNYQHLTGLRSSKIKSKQEFFSKCVSGRLSETEIELAKDGTTNQKLSVLPFVMKNVNLSANMLGNYNHSHPLLYTEKVVGGVRWGLGFRDVGGKFVPDTLLAGDIRDLVIEAYRIIATYAKPKNEEFYQNLVYKAKNIDYKKLKYPADWEYPKVGDNGD